MAPEIVSDFTKEKLIASAPIHKWYGRRGASTSLLSLLLTANPELAVDKEVLHKATDDPSAYESEIVKNLKVMDLCCGSGSLSEAAARLGAAVTAIDSHPIPVLMTRVTLQYSQLFSKASKRNKGCSTDKTWAGLGQEIAYWLNELISEAKTKAHGSWWPDVDIVHCEKMYQCPNCLSQSRWPSRHKPDSSKFRWVDAESVWCMSCGDSLRNDYLTPAELVPVSISMLNSKKADEGAIADCINSSFPNALSDSLDDIWFETASPKTSLRLQDFCSPRQAELLVALRHAYRTIRDRLSDLNYDPLRAKALLESMALCLSNALEYLSYSCAYDFRLKRVMGLQFLHWRAASKYVEIGGSRLEVIIKKNGKRISDLLSTQSMGSRVCATSMDMQNIDSLPDKYDLVLWDPPYYDNIDYAGMARPWTLYLRSLLGDIDTLLSWDNATNSIKSVVSEEDYREKVISGTLKAISAILIPGGKLGMLWMRIESSEQEAFGHLIGEATKYGLELVQSYRLIDSKSLFPKTAKNPVKACVLFIFSRTVGPAIPTDASRILMGASEGRSMMYQGIVEILKESLEHDEIEFLIHDGYKGTQLQRLAETVMSSPNPIDLLRDVNRRDLKKYALGRGISEADIDGKSADQMRRIVLQLLGWSMPSIPRFTIESALEELSSIEAEIRLVNSEQEIRGLATKAFDRLERILRFSVIAWAHLISPSDWKEPVRRITTKESRYSFGDWHRCLVEIPSKYASQSAVAGRINGLLNKNKVQKSIEPLLKLRNTICHHDQSKENWTDIKGELLGKLSLCIDSLRRAYLDKALPMILMPERETRDIYGRITLRLISSNGLPYEFLMTHQADLSQPVVVIACGSNPREVEPWLKNAAELCDLASV